MANCLSKRDQMVYSIFSKIVPLGHQGFLFKWFQGENECLLGLPTMTTNFFENPITKNLEIFFFYHHFFCTDFTIMTFIPLFQNISKIHNDKRRPKQVYSFHANADIKVMFTFLKKYIHE